LRTATICRRPPRSLPSLTGLAHLPDNLPSHKWLGYFRKMPLLTELDSFTLPFLQIGQSYGLRRLRVLRATKNSNANRPKRSTQNDFGTAFVPTGQPEISPERARPRAQQPCQPSRHRNIKAQSPSVPCCGRGRPHSAVNFVGDEVTRLISNPVF
jgi:hypothetical protein